MPDYPKPTAGDLKQAREFLRKRRRHAISIVEASTPTPHHAPYPSSYFGGLPFLPEGVAWPRLPEGAYAFDPNPAEGELNFIAQMTLADLPHIDASPLPSSGRLLFFSRTDFDDNPQPGDTAVIYDPAAATGAPTPPPATLRPLVDNGMYPSSRPAGLPAGVEQRYSLRFAAIDTYPRWHDIPRHPAYRYRRVHQGQIFDLAPGEETSGLPGTIVRVETDEGISGLEMAFDDVFESLRDEAAKAAWKDDDPSSRHQMLGYGIRREAEQNAGNALLLQIHYTPFTSWMSDGVLSFWISPDDLRARDFAKAFATGEWA